MVNWLGYDGQTSGYARSHVLDAMGNMLGWYPRAACRNADPSLFDRVTQTEQAEALCRVCPVMKECRQAFLAMPDFEGVAGGWIIRRRNGRTFLLYDLINAELLHNSHRDFRAHD